MLGRVNRRFAPRVDVVACGIWPTAVPAGARRCTSAIRCARAVLDREGATYIEPGDWPMGLLVIGGSQGAGLFARVVPEALRLLDAGAPRPAAAQPAGAAGGHGPGAGGLRGDRASAAELRGFFDDVPERLAEATLVISRAGASSIADISVIGRPAILDPLCRGDWTTTRRRTPPGWLRPAAPS